MVFMAHNPFMRTPDPDNELIALIDRVAARDELAFKALYDHTHRQAV